ncbi:MAG: hypothetical protein LBO77_03725 [Desulfovibrio sp.]|jgi:hypothetical protein|nr:hypothetical protein [Desulfovibrio sp.]
MQRRLIKILNAKIELMASFPIIHASNYFSTTDVESLLSDYRNVEDLPADTACDGVIIIIDAPGEPFLCFSGNEVAARGPFAALEREMKDKRYTLLGNQGLLYRFLLYILEKEHGIFSFHANALYHEGRNELFVVFGGAASGKSPALLAGLCNGLKVVGTELVHFSMDKGGCSFYRSSCLDNVRPSCISEDFPELLERLRVPGTRGFSSPSSKFLLDMRMFGEPRERLDNPKLRLVVPKVEAGRSPAIADRVADTGLKRKMLFDNLSEKIGASFTMYNSMACTGFDNPMLAGRRLHVAEALLAAAGQPDIEIYLASPRYFLEVLK